MTPRIYKIEPFECEYEGPLFGVYHLREIGHWLTGRPTGKFVWVRFARTERVERAREIVQEASEEHGAWEARRAAATEYCLGGKSF